MKFINYRGIILILFLLMIPFQSIIQAASDTEMHENRILVLHSFKAKKPWAMLFNQYLVEEMKKSKLSQYTVEFEALDLLEFNDESYKEKLKDILKYKYNNEPPDILILTFSSAIDFIKESGLFKEIPKILILPSGTEYTELPNSIVLPFAIDFIGSIKHCLELLPNTKNLYVVAGNADVDSRTLASFSNDTGEFSDRISFNYLSQLDADDLLSRVSELPPDSVVYYLSYSLDTSGRSIVARDFCRLIGEKANRPVFTYIDLFALETGILGGKVTTTKASASSAAEIIKKISKEKAIGSLPVQKPKFEYIYDWQEIKKWGIDEDKLPANSVIQNRPYSFYEIFKWRILGGILIILAEAILVILLMINIKKRRAAESSLRNYSYELEATVERRTADLRNTVTDLQQALSEIRSLKGIIPICSYCKNIRDDEGYWKQIENYISEHSEAEFSHGLCPECVKKYYPDLVE